MFAFFFSFFFLFFFFLAYWTNVFDMEFPRTCMIEVGIT